MEIVNSLLLFILIFAVFKIDKKLSNIIIKKQIVKKLKNEEKPAAIFELLKNKESARSIADKLGVSKTTVFRHKKLFLNSGKLID